MSLTRKALLAMGVEEDKAAQICEWHSEDMTRLNGEIEAAKADAEKYKADASKLKKVEKELEEYKEKADKPDAYKEKYEKLKGEFDTYKGEVEAKETKAAKTKAYKEMLKEVKISEDWLDDIVKFSDLDTIELDDDGKIKGVEELTKAVKEKYSKYIAKETTAGAQTPTPPANTGGGVKTKDEIMKIKDYDERQKAIAENHTLFGF